MSTPPLPFVRDPRWVFDFALTAIVWVVCFAVAAVPVAGAVRDVQTLSFLLVSSLLVRRSLPRVALVWAGLASLQHAYYLPTPSLSIVVVPMIVYAVTRHGTPRTGVAALWFGLAGAVIGPFRWAIVNSSSIPIFAITATACAAIVTGAFLLGRQLREQRTARAQRDQAEAERLRLQQSEQEQRARAVAVDERSRIARELHDIVAHSLSVIVVQAEGGRAVVLKKPEVAAQVLDTIAETGRTSLSEMRRIVDLLRGDRTDPSYLPSPGLVDIPELVSRSGDRFQLGVEGDPPAVSPTVGLTVYRVVQESITNVLKHGGPVARAWVNLGYSASGISIEVIDDGRGAAAAHTAGAPLIGHGLRGMSERIMLLHGTLDARPRPGGGFVVRVDIPLLHNASAPRSGS